jgi:hypothetical protein
MVAANGEPSPRIDNCLRGHLGRSIGINFRRLGIFRRKIDMRKSLDGLLNAGPCWSATVLRNSLGKLWSLEGATMMPCLGSVLRPRKAASKGLCGALLCILDRLFVAVLASAVVAGRNRRCRLGRSWRKICPTGKSLIRLSSPACKNIPLLVSPKSILKLPPSRPTQRGVSRSSRTLGRDAVDADGAADESA